MVCGFQIKEIHALGSPDLGESMIWSPQINEIMIWGLQIKASRDLRPQGQGNP